MQPTHLQQQAAYAVPTLQEVHEFEAT